MKIKTLMNLFKDLKNAKGVFGSIIRERDFYNSTVSHKYSSSFITVEYTATGIVSGGKNVTGATLDLNEHKNTAYWDLFRGTSRANAMEDVYEFLDKHAPSIEKGFDSVDFSSLFKELFKGAKIQMVAKMPIYAAIMDRFSLIEDISAGTLYVTFNPILLSYEIHYNPEFIVKSMIKHSLTFGPGFYESFYNELTGYTALMFSHEMDHVLRSNLGASGERSETLNGVDAQLANLIQDSVINQSLSKIFMKWTPSVGIVNNIHSSFIIPPEVVGVEENTLINLVIDSADKAFKSINAHKVTGTRGEVLIKGNLGKLIIHLGDDILKLYSDNSNELSKDISTFIKGISSTSSIDELNQMLSGSSSDLKNAEESPGNEIKRRSGPMVGSPPPNKSSESTGGSSQQSGSSSQQSGSSSQQSGSSSQQSGSSSDSSGDSTGLSSSITNDISDEEKALAKEVLKNIVNSAESPKVSSEDLEKVDELKSSVDPELLNNVLNSFDKSLLSKVSTGSTVSSWKGRLKKLLYQCLGIKEVYSNEVPSARIEGAFGRELEEPSIKTIVLSIDCSGSMGPSKFKKVIKEIEIVGKALNSRSVQIKVVYWGGSSYLYKTKGTKGLSSKIESNSKKLGTTNFNQACDFMAKNTSKFDLMIVMTDGEFSGKPTPSSKAFISKNKRKVVWVLCSGGKTELISQYDSSYNQRLIKQK